MFILNKVICVLEKNEKMFKNEIPWFKSRGLHQSMRLYIVVNSLPNQK